MGVDRAWVVDFSQGAWALELEVGNSVNFVRVLRGLCEGAFEEPAEFVVSFVNALNNF